MLAARDLALYYERELLPQRTRILDLTLRQYNAMFKGAYDLLLAKQAEVEAEQARLDAWRDYWIARARLERAAGGTLPSGEAKDASAAQRRREADDHETHASCRAARWRRRARPASGVSTSAFGADSTRECRAASQGTGGYTPVITPDGATLPFAMTGSVKEFHLTAEPVRQEFAPGMTVNAGATTAARRGRRWRPWRATASASW